MRSMSSRKVKRAAEGKVDIAGILYRSFKAIFSRPGGGNPTGVTPRMGVLLSLPEEAMPEERSSVVQRKASPFLLLAVLIPCLASASSVVAEELAAVPQVVGPVRSRPSKPDTAQKPRTHGHPEITIRKEARVILPLYDMSTELRPA